MPVGATTSPVHLPTIQPVLCPMGVHQSDEAPCHLPMEYGVCIIAIIYRRHAADGRVHQSVIGLSGRPDIPADKSGFCHQHTQVDHNPNSTDQVLGRQVDSTSLQWCLPGEKLQHIRMEINHNLQKSQVTAHQLAQLIGKLHATSPAVSPISLFYWSLQGYLQKELDCSNQDYDTLLSISA